MNALMQINRKYGFAESADKLIKNRLMVRLKVILLNLLHVLQVSVKGTFV